MECDCGRDCDDDSGFRINCNLYSTMSSSGENWYVTVPWSCSSCFISSVCATCQCPITAAAFPYGGTYNNHTCYRLRRWLDTILESHPLSSLVVPADVAPLPLGSLEVSDYSHSQHNCQGLYDILWSTSLSDRTMNENLKTCISLCHRSIHIHMWGEIWKKENEKCTLILAPKMPLSCSPCHLITHTCTLDTLFHVYDFLKSTARTNTEL